MKKLLNYIGFSGALVVSMTACHKIDVPVTTQLTPEVFPQSSTQFIQAAGPAYMALRGNYSLDYHFMQSLSTDESILPARGGNWYDNRNYIDLHFHTWTKDHGNSNGTWSWLSRVVGATNQALGILDKAMPAGTDKDQALAELKMVRALAYFMFMDLYGNVPIYSSYGELETAKEKSSRAEVFKFIEDDVKGSLPYLSNVVGKATYGRANKYTAYALLAKMYLNAEVYTGTKRYTECVAYCDSVISSGKYSVEPMASYLQMFYPTNGPDSQKEFIFAMPYDPAAGTGLFTNGYMYHARYDVPRSEAKKFNLPFTPSSARSTLPEFYAYFNDANDVRNKQWLTGFQFNSDGSKVEVKTTPKGYDQFYTGTDTTQFTYQVELTPNIVLRQSVPLVDLGNDEIAWNMGYRNVKFYPDATSTNRNQNNDVPMFRYSDIILMKAEAILRGAAATLGHTPLSLVNSVRSQRTTSAPLGNVDLEFIYTERSREFAWESWHRNDMIRFGKYEGSWGFKTNNETYRRIFPIPTTALTLNPKLTPNPGY